MMRMIKVWSTPHTAFAVGILLKNLVALGFPAARVERVDPRDPSLHILYNAARVKRLPANYIVYQTEVAGSKWFNRKYRRTIAEALAVWEYDAANVAAYQRLNANVFLVTPGVEPQPETVKDNSVLFYGCVKRSPCRERLLREIGRAAPIRVVTDRLTDEIWPILTRSHTVLNLHYYENAPLETFRINEALSFGCRVVSQGSPSGMQKYQHLVRFAEEVESLLDALRLSLQDTSAPDLSSLDNRAEIEQAMQQSVRLKRRPTRAWWLPLRRHVHV